MAAIGGDRAQNSFEQKENREQKGNFEQKERSGSGNHPEQATGLLHVARTLWRLLPRGDGRRLALLGGMMFIGSLLEMIGVGIIPVFVAILADPEPVLEHARLQPVLASLGIDDTGGLLVAGAVVLVAVFLIKNVYVTGYHYLEARYTWNRYTWLASRLFRAYMTAPYSFHRRRNSSALLRNITEESRFLVQEVLSPLLRLTMNALLVLAIFLLLLIVEPLITLGALVVVGGGGTLFLYLIKKRISRYGLQAHNARLGIIHMVNQALEGIKDIRVLRREHWFVNWTEEHVQRYSRSQTFWMTAMHANKPVIETVAVIGIMVIALTLWMQGRPVTAIVPVLALYGAATVRLLPDIKLMINQINSLRYFRQSVMPVSRDLMQLDPEGRLGWSGPGAGLSGGLSPAAHGVTSSGAAPVSIREIRFDAVTYTYPDAERPVIDGVSLEVPGGSFVGFAGPSGGGKTTLADLLLGLFHPDSGRILIDDRPIERWLDEHPDGVGYIPQSIFLLDDSLRRNIALGIPDEAIDEERIRRSVEAARLGEVVADLADGLDTPIGERGVRLSGGQRQRIGIARALYHEPALIVMDEATSALDHATESEVMAAVEQLRGTRTVILIAHRLSTVRSCDRVCYLENGRITDSGTFEELAERHEAFRG